MWIKDEEFLRDKVPMTKFHIRTLIMGMLEIKKDDVLLDIGSGTGTISIEASLRGGKVFTIDSNPLAVELTKKNSEKFSANVKVFKGFAPDDLEDLKINKCFIGGSKGNLEAIFNYLENNLEINGILVGSFITLKNLEEFRRLLKKYNYQNTETILAQISKEDSLGLMKGENPIFIVKGIKND